MGRSLRKFKKNKPKVRVGVQKKRKELKGPAPLTVPGTDRKIEWDCKSTLVENFQASGILLDPNRLQAIPNDQSIEESNDVRSALGLQRKDGKRAPLQKLTKMQRVYIARLIEKYNDDFEAMSKDIKLNQMQHSHGTLKKLCARYNAYKSLLRETTDAPTST